MVLLHSLPLIFASLFSTVPTSVGAYQDQLVERMSDAYIKGELHLSPNKMQEVECLSKNIWYEARGESIKGKTMVANVVYNRMNYGRPFANTVCGVVYQKSQFSWTLEANKKNSTFQQIAKKHWKIEHRHVKEANMIAIRSVVFGPPNLTTATHFCSATCNFKAVRFEERVGGHDFFTYLSKW